MVIVKLSSARNKQNILEKTETLSGTKIWIDENKTFKEKN